jgi:hypothetical protein
VAVNPIKGCPVVVHRMLEIARLARGVGLSTPVGVAAGVAVVIHHMVCQVSRVTCRRLSITRATLTTVCRRSLATPIKVCLGSRLMWAIAHPVRGRRAILTRACPRCRFIQAMDFPVSRQHPIRACPVAVAVVVAKPWFG